MERAAGSIRRRGTVLLSMGTGYQALNLIITELKNFKALIKAARDSQAKAFYDICNWAVNEESKIAHELIIHVMELNDLWIQTQSKFAEQISEFRRQYELILDGEKAIDIARNKLAECEIAEQKAKKKLKKVQKKDSSADISAIANKVAECERQKEVAQAEVSQRLQENEASKITRVRESIVKLSDAYVTYGNKCVYIFEGQRELAGTLPDVEARNIHQVTSQRSGIVEEILKKTQQRVKRYTEVPSSEPQYPQNRNTDPPPPYSATMYYSVPPVNPYYIGPEGYAGAGARTMAVIPEATGAAVLEEEEEAANYSQQANQNIPNYMLNARHPDEGEEELARGIGFARI